MVENIKWIQNFMRLNLKQYKLGNILILPICKLSRSYPYIHPHTCISEPLLLLNIYIHKHLLPWFEIKSLFYVHMSGSITLWCCTGLVRGFKWGKTWYCMHICCCVHICIQLLQICSIYAIVCIYVAYMLFCAYMHTFIACILGSQGLLILCSKILK